MRVLVTGGAGFVGRRLMAALLARGHAVVGIDNRCPTGAAAQLAGLIRHADLRDGRRLAATLPTFDVCVHLASDVGGFLHNAGRDELPDHEAALVEATVALCRQLGCRRIIYTSSIAVFEDSGSFSSGPLGTSHQTTPYARGKAVGERLLAAQCQDFTVVRPTNVFGPHQPCAGTTVGESHVIPDLLRKLADPAPFEVLGDGSQRRNFLHVDDLVRFLIAVLAGPRRAWFNVRSDIELTIGELATHLMRATGQHRPIHYRPEFMRYEPAPIRPFDLSAARAVGWRPLVADLVDGLALSPYPASPSSGGGARSTSMPSRRRSSRGATVATVDGGASYHPGSA